MSSRVHSIGVSAHQARAVVILRCMNYSIAASFVEGVYGIRSWINDRLDARWNNDPFGTEPLASAEEYRALFQSTRVKQFPEVDEVENETGFAVDRSWLDDLAFHTQIVRKKSELAYPHGRLLYSLLREYVVRSGERFVTVLETGTARGFSALCMAKALEDAGVDGRIVTLDVLPHLRRQYWNCIDDHEHKKSRAELLQPWSALTRRILFIQGDTLMTLPRLGLDRINFAFLDAQHIASSVLKEFEVVQKRQRAGDVVFFDDVTPLTFPGVVEAVQRVEQGGQYAVRRLTISEERAYAWGQRTQATH